MRAAFALFALASLAACESPRGPSSNEAGGAGNLNANAAGATANAAEIKINKQALDRFGPIRVGATVAQLADEGLAIAGRDQPPPGSTCSYARFKGVPGLAAMLDGEKVVRIDISSPQHEGPYGLRVGQDEATALARLDGATVEPHPYTGPEGHYLSLHAAGAPFGLIAETDGKTVQRWRIGQWEQVQWVETCF